MLLSDSNSWNGLQSLSESCISVLSACILVSNIMKKFSLYEVAGEFGSKVVCFQMGCW